jgi:serine/threonine protein kinase
MLQRSSSDPRGFIAKVCDFGLARVAADGKLINRMAGTISHISPEQFQHGTASMAGDVWAFGVLMWEAFTGKRAYDNWESSDIMAAVTSGQVPLLLHDSAPLQFRVRPQRRSATCHVC